MSQLPKYRKKRFQAGPSDFEGTTWEIFDHKNHDVLCTGPEVNMKAIALALNKYNSNIPASRVKLERSSE